MLRIVSFLSCVFLLSACHGTETEGTDMRTADVALHNGSPDVTLGVVSKYLKAHPDDVHALCMQGNAEALKERMPQAEASFNRVLALNGKDECALVGLGRLKLRVDPEEAISLLLRVAAHSPSDATALIDLGIAYDLQGKHEKAQQLYTQVIAANPENLDAVINMGLSLALSGKAQTALQYLEPMTRKADCPNRIRGDTAFAMVQIGRLDEAEALLHTYLPEGEVKTAMKRYAEFR